MTDQNLEPLIDAMNAGQMRDRIFPAALSAHVEVAKVWMDHPRGSGLGESSYNVFFIKEGDGAYVAAVLDMQNDLHVLVKEAHRKHGHLTRAMKSVILPKLRQDGRGQQRVTFRDAEIGAYCKRNWGFHLTGEDSAELDLGTLPECERLSPKGRLLAYEDFAEIKSKLTRSKVLLRMVREQLEMAYGSCEDLDIQELEYAVSDLDDDIFDFIQGKQGILQR
jgi:hypothetical protein